MNRRWETLYFQKACQSPVYIEGARDLGTFFLRGLGIECLMGYTGLLQYQINIGRHIGTHIVPLGMKGCICHFVKWQIHPFISKGSIYSLSSRLMKSRYILVWYSVHETDGMSQLNDQIPVLANSCNMYHRHRCTIKCIL